MPSNIPTLEVIEVRLSIPVADGGVSFDMATAIPQGCTDDGANIVLDKMARLLQRQRAILRLPKMRAELKVMRHHLDLARTRLEECDAKWERVRADHRENVGKMRDESHAISRAVAEHWAASGRQGEVQAAGKEKARLTQLAGELESSDKKLVALGDKHLEERGPHWSKLVELEFDERLAMEQIDECENQVRGRPVHGVSEE